MELNFSSENKEIDFSKLYCLSGTLRRNALRVDVHYEEGRLDAFALLRGEFRPSAPLICKWNSGGTPKDIIGTSYAVVKLISDRMVCILHENRFTGWTTFPVLVYDKRKQFVPGYHGLSVTGRCGPIDYTKSRDGVWAPVPLTEENIAIRIKCRMPLERKGMSVKIGLFFDPNTWDGSDLFVPEGHGAIIVTERVRNALTVAKVTNAEFTRLTEYEEPYVPSRE